jgi:hypothetical protein
VRSSMRWRLHIQRMLLFRPALLNYAMRRIPYVALRSEERTAIDKCFAHAAEVIRDISSARCTSQNWGWNAVWFLFQAVLIPLLGLYIDDRSNSSASCSPEAWQAQVETVVASLIRLRLWSPFVVPTLNGICRLHKVLESRSPRSRRRESDLAAVTPRLSSDLGVGHFGLKPSSGGDVNPNVNNAGDGTGQPPARLNVNFTPMALNIGSSPDQNMWDYIAWSDERVGTDFALAQFSATFSNAAITQYYDPSGHPALLDPYSVPFNFDDPTSQSYHSYQTYSPTSHPGS